MNYGRFFKLNTSKSQLNTGIAIFDYIWLRDEESATLSETPEYPIYVAITKEYIEFKAHFYAPAMTIESREEKIHLHNTILSFPLSANLEVKDGLTKTLVESYDTAFPSSKNNYLFILLMKAVSSDKNEISYSNLDIFNKDSKYIGDVLRIKRNSKTIEGFIRKLILDFLFDLEHTSVFQNSPYYEHISVKLKENFFFNALANKAMYYYYREIAKEYTDEKIFEFKEYRSLPANETWTSCYKYKEDNRKEDRKLFFLKEYFLPAEEQWIKSITSPKAGEAFTDKSEGWFEIPEKEMTDLQSPKKNKSENVISYFEKNKNSINDSKIKTRIKKSAKYASKWQLEKYDLLNVLPVMIFLAWDIFFVFAIHYSKEINFCKTVSGIILLLLLLVTVYCRRKVKYSKGIHLFLPRLLGAIIGSWLMISFASNVFPQFYAIVFTPKNCLLWKNIGIIVILFLLTAVFVYDGIDRRSPYLKCCQKRCRTLQLIFVAFYYSYVIGIFATALIGTEAITEREYEYSIPPDFGESNVYISPGFLLVFTFVAMFIGLFINRIFEDKQVVDSE